MSNSFNLLVKFKPESISRVNNGRIYFFEHNNIMRHDRFVLDFAYRMAIPELSTNGEFKCKENSIDFSKYKGLVYVEADLTDDQWVDLAAQYRRLSIVEYAELEPAQPCAPPHLEDTELHDEDTDPYISVSQLTPNLTGHQQYLRNNPAPNVFGIDADFGWSQGALGQGIRMANIEWGHNFRHEDVVGSNFIELRPTTNHYHDEHGTAVASITMARNNGIGMLGAAYNLQRFYGVSELNAGRVAGITAGLQVLRPGDVFLYQMQTLGRTLPNGSRPFVPPDFDRGVWDITREATQAGIVVVITAGNGGEDLSHAFYNEFRNRGDNGGIRVGAGSRMGRNRLYFSTFGQGMVHVQGWGQQVASAGYGRLFNAGFNRRYTDYFSGTSSAGAIVAAAVVAIQSWYKSRFNRVLNSQAMRSLLIQTGTPQGSGGHIGPLPNIRRAIEALSGVPAYPQWLPTREYTAGNRVSWNGANWVAQWWSFNVEPGTTEQGSSAFPWRQL